jgi:pantetheine-phosphate adenylyltransferase
MRALYPGSFDPLTLGHLDLIERGCCLFGEVVVAVLQNPGKTPAFSLEQRCAEDIGADLILRGLRAMSDFEYELQIAHTNRSLQPEIETVFLATSAHHSFLSSSVVKEVARFGGRVSHMVPEVVAQDLARLFNLSFSPEQR